MRSIPIFAALAILPAIILPQRGAASPTAEAAGESDGATPADREWNVLQSIATAPRPSLTSKRERLEWTEQHEKEITGRALAFYRGHPTDPRRWSAAWLFISHRPEFITEIKPDFETRGMAATTRDELAGATRDVLCEELLAKMAQAPDLPQDVLEIMAQRALGQKLGEIENAIRARTPFDFSGARESIQGLYARYPQNKAGAVILSSYMRVFEVGHPGKVAGEWARFVDSPHGEVARLAREKVRFYELARAPIEIAFRAVDGRAVDLKKLRGKVVLVDFWATWCGPCVAELPNIKKVYSAYHDQGFEVIGISLENAQLGPMDDTVKAAEKLARAREVLLGFLSLEQVPWPQYFDGKVWKNDLAVRYAIIGIPAMFLLDRDGKLVSTDARGPKLEAEVKRLLNL